MSFQNQTPQVSTHSPTNFSSLPSPGPSIRHILLGTPGHIRQTIHLLHNLNYVETSQWSPLLDVPDRQLILRPDPEDVICILVKRL